MRILYVEDDPRDADLLERELRHHMPQVTLDIVTTITEAYHQLTDKNSFDLALIDLHLSKGSGLDVLAEIRRKDLPLAVIILTGRGDEEAAVAALKAGADDYLVKRGDYLSSLPMAIKTTLKRFHSEKSQKALPIKVLYVEHNAADVDLTRRHLARYAPNIQLDVTYSTNEALHKLEKNCKILFSYDVLLLDYRLPGMNALEMLKTLQQKRKLDLPVVLVTGQGNEESVVQALRLGAVDYLIKHPGYLFQLPSTLENAFHRSQISREKEKLRQSETRLLRFMENAQDIIYRIRLTPNRCFEYVNRAATTITGYTPEEHYTDPNLGFKMVHPEDRYLLEAASNGTIPVDQPLTMRWIRKDGKVIWTEQRNVPIFDDAGNLIAIEGVARDITERKLAEERIREAAQYWQKTFDASSDAICLIDVEKNIVRANRAMAELTGKKMEELVGHKCCEVVNGGKHSLAVCPVKKARKTLCQEQSEFQIKNKWLSINVDPVLGESNNIQHMIHIIRDITPQKAAENSLRQRLIELEALHKVSSTLRSAGSIDEMLPNLLDEILAFFQTKAGAIWLYHPSRNELRFTVARGWFSQLEEFSLNPGEGIAGKVFSSGQSHLSQEFATDPILKYTKKIPKGWGGVCIPIKAQEDVVGVLFVSIPSSLCITSQELRLLDSLAEIAGIAIDNAQLFEEVQQANVDLTLAYDATIEGWARALELRDRETEGHARRVTEMTARIARVMGVSEAKLVHVRRGALLHDMGKLGVRDEILLKPGKLNEEEWENMRRHPRLAYEMLFPIEHLRPALEIPYCHHEKWDGTGYPRGLKGEQIPLDARIFAVVDVYDALTSHRPYRSAWTKEQALEHVRKLRGSHFDPKVVDMFIKEIGGMHGNSSRQASRISLKFMGTEN